MAISGIEHMTITIPADIAAAIKEAVAGGECAPTSEVVREAICEWKSNREFHLQEFANLKAEIDKGLAELAAGRTTIFDRNKIITRGNALLTNRLPSD